ncbi:MAG: hypothetical protein AAGJ40_09400 [Planctomycetota bacterium]
MSDDTDDPKRFRDFEKLGIEKIHQAPGPHPPQRKVFSGAPKVEPTPRQSMTTVDLRHAELVVACEAHMELHLIEAKRHDVNARRISLAVSLSLVAGGMLTVAAVFIENAVFSGFVLAYSIAATFASVAAHNARSRSLERDHSAARSSWNDIRQDLVSVPTLPKVEQRACAVARIEEKSWRVLNLDITKELKQGDIVAMEQDVASRLRRPLA